MSTIKVKIHVVALFFLMLWVSAVPAMPKMSLKIASSVGEIDFKIVVVFAVFWPISPTKRPTYRRQTSNILLRHVGLLWLLVTC